MDDFDRSQAAIRASVTGFEKFCMLNFILAVAVAFFLLSLKFWFGRGLALHQATFLFIACLWSGVLFSALVFIPLLKPRASFSPDAVGTDGLHLCVS